MAERRMMSKQFIMNASFLKMSDSAKLLYFYLNINADDDGIVEAYAYSQMLSTPEDDVKLLCQKEFIIFLNDDWLVFLPHWLQNQTLRSDRFRPSIYRNILLNKFPEYTSKVKLITEEQHKKTVQVVELLPEVYNKIFGIPGGNQSEPQIRLDQNILEQRSIDKSSVDELELGKMSRSRLQKAVRASFLDVKSIEIIMDRVNDMSENKQAEIFELISQTKSSVEKKAKVIIDSKRYESNTHQMLERVLNYVNRKLKMNQEMNVLAYLNKSFTEYWEKILETIYEERKVNHNFLVKEVD